MKIRSNRDSDEITLQMTPMIDIVFQLLVFFIMTFKPVDTEGDFSVKMPLNDAPGSNTDSTEEAFTLELYAGENGHLNRATFNSADLGDSSLTGSAYLESVFRHLRKESIALAGSQTGPDAEGNSPELEIKTSYGLRHRYTVAALTAASGRLDSSENVVPLFERTKFGRYLDGGPP